MTPSEHATLSKIAEIAEREIFISDMDRLHARFRAALARAVATTQEKLTSEPPKAE